jgi:hypothetical protein
MMKVTIPTTTIIEAQLCTIIDLHMLQMIMMVMMTFRTKMMDIRKVVSTIRCEPKTIMNVHIHL